MILNDQIKTTEAKAKSIKADVEKIITIAKKGGDNAEHELYKKIQNKEAVQKTLKTLGPLFKDRPGGYTRIIRIENRLKDNARMVLFQFVEKAEVGEVISVSKKRTDKKSSKTVKKTNVKNPNILTKNAKTAALKSVRNIATKTTRMAKRGDK